MDTIEIYEIQSIFQYFKAALSHSRFKKIPKILMSTNILQTSIDEASNIKRLALKLKPPTSPQCSVHITAPALVSPVPGAGLVVRSGRSTVIVVSVGSGAPSLSLHRSDVLVRVLASGLGQELDSGL